MVIVSGCGILPISENNGKLYIFCGIEKNGKISDLGGRIEKGESSYQCAVREFYEESVGMLITYEDLLKAKVRRKVTLKFNGKSYVSYIINMKYKPVEYRYDKLIEYIKKNKSKMVDMDFRNYDLALLFRENIYPEGFFEFYKLKWIPLNDLIQMVLNKDKRLKYRLRKILCHILS